MANRATANLWASKMKAPGPDFERWGPSSAGQPGACPSAVLGIEGKRDAVDPQRAARFMRPDTINCAASLSLFVSGITWGTEAD